MKHKTITCRKCGTVQRVQESLEDDEPCPNCFDYELVKKRMEK